MENKLNLVLTEKDLLEGLKNLDINFAIKFRIDAISVLEYMIKNRTLLKIDLLEFETKEECGIYRCICGWWAYHLDIPIKTKSDKFTARFNETLNNVNAWTVFKAKNKMLYNSYYNNVIFLIIYSKTDIASILNLIAKFISRFFSPSNKSFSVKTKFSLFSIINYIKVNTHQYRYNQYL